MAFTPPPLATRGAHPIAHGDRDPLYPSSSRWRYRAFPS
jgi:hypothetical protein